jgi:hypothetical protein
VSAVRPAHLTILDVITVIYKDETIKWPPSERPSAGSEVWDFRNANQLLILEHFDLCEVYLTRPICLSCWGNLLSPNPRRQTLLERRSYIYFNRNYEEETQAETDQYCQEFMAPWLIITCFWWGDWIYSCLLLQFPLIILNYNSSQKMTPKTRSSVTGLRLSSLLLWLAWFRVTLRLTSDLRMNSFLSERPLI